MKTNQLSCFLDYSMTDKELAAIFTVTCSDECLRGIVAAHLMLGRCVAPSTDGPEGGVPIRPGQVSPPLHHIDPLTGAGDVTHFEVARASHP
jgi:hypothetical protein